MTDIDDNNWYVYIVECKDGSLYTGITNNLVKRILAHNKGKGAKYTRGRTPVVLKAVKGNLTQSQAATIEYHVKKQKKENKIKFLNNIRFDEQMDDHYTINKSTGIKSLRWIIPPKNSKRNLN
jgi:putative endonuclease